MILAGNSTPSLSSITWFPLNFKHDLTPLTAMLAGRTASDPLSQHAVSVLTPRAQILTISVVASFKIPHISLRNLTTSHPVLLCPDSSPTSTRVPALTLKTQIFPRSLSE